MKRAFDSNAAEETSFKCLMAALVIGFGMVLIGAWIWVIVPGWNPSFFWNLMFAAELTAIFAGGVGGYIFGGLKK